MNVVATNAYRAELAARTVTGDAAPVPYKVAFGNGDRVEDIADTALESELFRVDPDSVTVDGLVVTVVATIDYSNTQGDIVSEMGVFAQIGASEVLVGRKVFIAKELTEPDRSEFSISFTF